MEPEVKVHEIISFKYYTSHLKELQFKVDYVLEWITIFKENIKHGKWTLTNDNHFKWESDSMSYVCIITEDTKVEDVINRIKSIVCATCGEKTFYIIVDNKHFCSINCLRKYLNNQKLYHDFGNGPVLAHKHCNGGGWVADTATVAKTAFVGPNAVVFGCAKVLNHATITHNAKVFDYAKVCNYARICGNAEISDYTEISGSACIGGYSKVFNSAKIFDNVKSTVAAKIGGHVQIYGNAEILGNNLITGNLKINNA